MNNPFTKSLLALTAVSLLSVPSLAQAEAGSNILVNIDGREQTFTDAQPYIKNNRTLVPFRAVLESLGATVQWNEATGTITATKGDTVVTLKVGARTATVNGESVSLDAAAEISNNRTMVPLRFLGEVLGADVQWNAGASTAVITTGMYPPGLRRSLDLQISSEPSTFDPSLVTDMNTMDVLAQTNEGLVRLTEKGQPIPGVAKAWEVSADGKSYTFHLRDDARWADGSKVTAMDFEYAWKRTINPQTMSQYAFLMNWIKGATEYNAGKGTADGVGVRAIDDVTLRVELTKPVAYFTEQLAFPIFFPQKQSFVEAQGDRFGTDADKVLPNGPFKLTQWTHEQTLTLEKNLQYWDRKEVKLAKAQYSVVRDPQAAYNLYLSGQLDRITTLDAEQRENLAGTSEFHTRPELIVSYVQFNPRVNALNNAKVRQALSLAVDRKLVTDFSAGHGHEPATGFVPTGTSNGRGGDFREVSGDYVKQDVAEAKRLLQDGLKEQGLTAFPSGLKLLIDDTMMARKMGELLQEQWKSNLGIDIAVDPQPFKIRLMRTHESDFDLVYSLWGADYNDPMTFLDLFTTENDFNSVKYNNPTYDALLEEAAVRPDAETRMSSLYHAEKLLMADMPITPIYFRNSFSLVKPHVKGFVEHPYMPSYDLKHTFLSGKK